MKMSKKYKRICLAFGLGTALCASVVNAANYTKSINATYRNIGVTYNGTSKTLSAEPFLVDGSTYVPLRAVSEIMGAEVNWNGSTNTVTITNTASDNTSLQQQLASANYQVTTLQRELETVKKELETYKNSNSSSSNSSTSVTTGTDITSSELTATENYLISNFSNELNDDIDFDFDLSKKGSRLQLTISYSDRSEDNTFNGIRESKVKDFIEDVCEAVADRHSNIEIQGVINYTRSDIDKASFTYSKSGRLSVDFGLDESDAKDIIWNTCSKLNLQAFSNVAIQSVDVNINDSNSTITFKLYINDGAHKDFDETWNANIDANQSLVRGQLRDIRDALQDESDYEVNGEIYKYSTSGKLLGSYDGKNNSLALYKIS